MPPSYWEQAVRDELESVSRRAHRPARGPVPPSAEAVLFEDAAELLACLASDVCSGLARERWWWRSLRLDRDPYRALIEGWLQSPQLVPPAFERLARCDELVPFVRRLPQRDSELLLRCVVTAFGLTHLQRVLEQGREPPGATSAERAVGSRPQLSALAEPARPPRGAGARALERRLRRGAGAALAHIPRAVFAPEALAPTLLTVEQQLLAGIVLALYRAPAVVRTAEFASEFVMWQDAAVSPAVLAVHPGAGASDLNDVTPLRETRWRPGNAHGSESSQPSTVRLEPVPAPAVRTDSAAELTATSERRNSTRLTRSRHRELTPPVSTSLETRFGGIFFLINVALALELYGDFTQPLLAGIELSIWDYLAWIGRRLLRRRQPSDPVWGLLRHLGASRRRVPVHPRFDWLVPATRGYLRQALNVSRRAHLGDVLLEHAARISVTPVYVDVYLSLDHLPISIRMAGLDRDPGWVPAAGRQIAFHFD